MRILLLGAKGFVGTNILKFLKDNNIEVIEVDKDNYNKHIGTECDVLINANGNSKKRLADSEPVTDFELNAVSTLKSLLDFKYKKYVYISTIDVYNDCSNTENNNENTLIDTTKLSNYGLSKYLSELLVKKYAQEWLIFRLGGMVGDGLKKNSIYDIIHLKKTFVSPESKYQYMHTYDVARVIIQIIERKKEIDDKKNDETKTTVYNEIYNLCGDGVIELKEAFEYADVPIPKDLDVLRKEIYNIDISKIKSLIEIKKTKETVREFIQNELSNM